MAKVGYAAYFGDRDAVVRHVCPDGTAVTIPKYYTSPIGGDQAKAEACENHQAAEPEPDVVDDPPPESQPDADPPPDPPAEPPPPVNVWTRRVSASEANSEERTGYEFREYTMQDDGWGRFPEYGSVDYSTGAITLRFVRNNTYSRTESTHNETGASGSLNGSNSETTSAEVTTRKGAESLVEPVTVTYALAGSTGVSRSESIAPPSLRFPIDPLYDYPIVPGTLRFHIGTNYYSDRAGQGVLYLDDGTVAGRVYYQSKVVVVDVYDGSVADTVVIDSLLTSYGDQGAFEYTFRTAGAPIQPGGFIVMATAPDGTLISESADMVGVISGPLVKGEIRYDTGLVRVRFGEEVADASLTSAEKDEAWYNPANIYQVSGEDRIWRPTYVYPNSVRYNAVVYTSVPLDADILGLNPVRLPSDGRVPIFKPGYVVVLHDTKDDTITGPLVTGDTHSLPRTGIAHVRMLDDTGNEVPGHSGGAADVWSLDKATGVITLSGDQSWPITAADTGANEVTVTGDAAALLTAGATITITDSTGNDGTYTVASASYSDPSTVVALNESIGDATGDGVAVFADTSAYPWPWTAQHIIEEMRLVTAVEITGAVHVNRAWGNDFPDTAKLSSALIFGDQQARYTNLFTQNSWTGVFSDGLIGDTPDAAYDDVSYPIAVENRGCVGERWALHFISSTAFEIIGETRGIVGTGTTGADATPINSLTDLPYFTVYHEGWGAGWNPGNVVRFNTVAAAGPLWVARTTQASDPLEGVSDGFRVQMRGDAD